MEKNLPANAGDVGSVPGPRRSPGGGHGNPLQYSCLDNPMDRGAWQVHRIKKSWTGLKRLSTAQHSTEAAGVGVVGRGLGWIGKAENKLFPWACFTVTTKAETDI